MCNYNYILIWGENLIVNPTVYNSECKAGRADDHFQYVIPQENVMHYLASSFLVKVMHYFSQRRRYGQSSWIIIICGLVFLDSFFPQLIDILFWEGDKDKMVDCHNPFQTSSRLCSNRNCKLDQTRSDFWLRLQAQTKLNLNSLALK